jgi:hypothetical protein
MWLRGLVMLTAVAALTMLAACVSVHDSSRKAPPTPMTTVEFESSPGSAEVYVDGEFRGSTPVRLQLAAGTHRVEIRLPGFQSWSRDLVVVAGDDTRVAARLEQE